MSLKSGHPLVFTYHHNRIDAYLPVAVALLDSGLTCSASLPCPAEMGASIHINRTGSSIIDTVFVCRSTGVVPRRLITESASDIARLIADDVEKLTCGGCRPSQGDIRCIIYGHLIRLAVWHLRGRWDKTSPTASRLRAVATWIERTGGQAAIENELGRLLAFRPSQKRSIREAQGDYETDEHPLPF